MTPRFDFVASYWLFAWWVLYYSGIVPFNPKFFLLLATIENVFGFIFILPLENVPSALFINIFLKVVPLILVWNTVTTKRDIVFGLFLGLVYIAWLRVNREEVLKVRTPLTDFLRKYNISY